MELQRLCKLTLLLFESTMKESVFVFLCQGKTYIILEKSKYWHSIHFLVKYLRISSPSRAKCQVPVFQQFDV